MRWLMVIGLVLVTVVAHGRPAKGNVVFDNPEQGERTLWRDVKFVPDSTDPTGKRGSWQGWFHQDNIDLSRRSEGIIRARIEGKWRELRIVELPQDFLDWNFGRRLEQLAEIKKMMSGDETAGRPEVAGPHNAIVASHGARRRDSEFTLNNAVKGTGWLPRPEKLAELIELLRRTWDDPMPAKLALLESLYTKETAIYDRTKQVSLELYARPDFATHSFLNQMADPGVAVVFLDLPKSYELRCVVQMLHPDDPGLSEYERQVVDYINLVHDYFHGAAPHRSIGVIYHVVQVFDNSPGRGRGRRIVPSLP